MRLRFCIVDPAELLAALQVALSAAAPGPDLELVFVFEAGRVLCVAATGAAGAVWAQFARDVFGGPQYVLSARDGRLAIGVSSQELAAVLGHASSCSVEVKLNYAQPAQGAKSGLVLSMSFDNMRFELNVRKLREPPSAMGVSDIRAQLTCQPEFLALLGRLQRYQRQFESATLTLDRDGHVTVDMGQPGKTQVRVSWKPALDARNGDGDERFDEDVALRVSNRCWLVAAKMLSCSSQMEIILCRQSCVFSVHVNDNPDYLILFNTPARMAGV